MARWVLNCPRCKQEFVHSDIPANVSTVRDLFVGFATKPEFPKGGVTMLCPNCKEMALYQRYQLVYRASQ
jgi:hypothetical protein